MWWIKKRKEPHLHKEKNAKDTIEATAWNTFPIAKKISSTKTLQYYWYSSSSNMAAVNFHLYTEYEFYQQPISCPNPASLNKEVLREISRQVCFSNLSAFFRGRFNCWLLFLRVYSFKIAIYSLPKPEKQGVTSLWFPHTKKNGFSGWKTE